MMSIQKFLVLGTIFRNVAPLKIARKYEIRGLKDTEQWFVFGGGLSTLKAFDF